MNIHIDVVFIDEPGGWWMGILLIAQHPEFSRITEF